MKTILLAAFLLGALLLRAQQPEIGIVQSMESDSVLQAAGYRTLTESISKCFSPITITDQQFETRLEKIHSLKLSINAANIFIPQELKLVGPTVREQAIKEYAEEVFKRCRQANIKLIIWGSGGARRIPEGFDTAQARQQFIAIAKVLAKLARQYSIVLALENLNHTETNFCLTVKETLGIVKDVNDPGLRLSPDVYHMMKENEGPEILIEAGKYIVNCEVAEKEGRTPPGTHGDDFRPYLRALKSIGYTGKVTIECRWTNLALEAAPARNYLQTQLAEAFR